ncbi:unnamed protein product, partial [Meganyctiphanes norvegica]
LHNDPVISTSVTCEGTGYFIDAQCTGSTTKTAEVCQELLAKSKTYAETTYGCQVQTVVTDNAKNMVKMRDAIEKVEEEGREPLITYGCLAHWLNLLGKDLTPDQLMKQVVDINKYFRSHHVPSA